MRTLFRECERPPGFQERNQVLSIFGNVGMTGDALSVSEASRLNACLERWDSIEVTFLASHAQSVQRLAEQASTGTCSLTTVALFGPSGSCECVTEPGSDRGAVPSAPATAGNAAGASRAGGLDGAGG